MKKQGLLLLTLLLLTVGCVQDRGLTKDYCNRSTPMALFIEPENDSLLRGMDGMYHLDLDSVWYLNPDTFSFAIKIDLYIDSLIPHRKILAKFEQSLNTSLIAGLTSYWIDSVCASRLPGLQLPGHPKSSMDIVRFWSSAFDYVSDVLSPRYPREKYLHAPDGKICGIVHKVYEDVDYVTYLEEYTYDFNGSCGCPSQAYFHTFNKRNGKLLDKSDIAGRFDPAELNRQLMELHIAEAAKKNIERYADSDFPFDYIEEADGCAIITEGILFYYLPYVIGGGSEEEYFLIIRKQ